MIGWALGVLISAAAPALALALARANCVFHPAVRNVGFSQGWRGIGGV